MDSRSVAVGGGAGREVGVVVVSGEGFGISLRRDLGASSSKNEFYECINMYMCAYYVRETRMGEKERGGGGTGNSLKSCCYDNIGTSLCCRYPIIL